MSDKKSSDGIGTSETGRAEEEVRRVLDEAVGLASRIRAQAQADVAKEVHEIRAGGRTLLEQAHAEVENAQLEAQRIIREAQSRAATIESEAAIQAAMERHKARSGRERVLARTVSELAKAREEAEREVEDLIRAGREAARRILDEARAQAAYEAGTFRSGVEGRQPASQPEAPSAKTWSERPRALNAIHSSEISIREFPKAWRGLDPKAVQSWLSLVEQSHSVLEDQLQTYQDRWDHFLHLFSRMSHGSVEGEDLRLGNSADRSKALDALGSARTLIELHEGDDTATPGTLLENPLAVRVRGYDQAQVLKRLDAAATQIARLRNQLADLRRENEALRSRLFDVLSAKNDHP